MEKESQESEAPAGQEGAEGGNQEEEPDEEETEDMSGKAAIQKSGTKAKPQPNRMERKAGIRKNPQERKKITLWRTTGMKPKMEKMRTEPRNQT